MKIWKRGINTNMIDLTLNDLFYPKNIAIIGVSSKKQTLGGKKMKTLIDYGYEGDMYIIHPTAEEINGIKAYPTVSGLPEKIDYAYIAVPKERIVETIESFDGKVKYAHIITSGFSEIGNHEEEQQILEAARKSNVRIVGPNCIGLYCPEGKMTFSKWFSNKVGSVSVFSQSGGLASDIGIRGNNRGLSFSKIISAGNCVDLNAVDFLEYFIDDPKTKVIGLYVESIENGRKFIDALKRNNHSKPIVLLKGGRTDEGTKAAASHTGAMSNDYEIIKGICVQFGVVLVNDYEELVDTMILLQTMPKEVGNKTLLLGMGGGATVSAIDASKENGLNIPGFKVATQKSLMDLNLPDGYSLKNPVDTPAWTLMAQNGTIIKSIVETAVKSERFDNLIIHLNLQVVVGTFGRDALDNLIQAVSELNNLDLNVIVILRNEVTSMEGPRVEYANKMSELDIPTLFNLNSAIQAVGKIVETNNNMSVEQIASKV